MVEGVSRLDFVRICYWDTDRLGDDTFGCWGADESQYLTFPAANFCEVEVANKRSPAILPSICKLKAQKQYLEARPPRGGLTLKTNLPR